MRRITPFERQWDEIIFLLGFSLGGVVSIVIYRLAYLFTLRIMFYR